MFSFPISMLMPELELVDGWLLRILSPCPRIMNCSPPRIIILCMTTFLKQLRDTLTDFTSILNSHPDRSRVREREKDLEQMTMHSFCKEKRKPNRASMESLLIDYLLDIPQLFPTHTHTHMTCQKANASSRVHQKIHPRESDSLDLQWLISR